MKQYQVTVDPDRLLAFSPFSLPLSEVEMAIKQSNNDVGGEVITLQAQEGRLFRPLAFTKTYSMAAAALLSVTLVPVLMGYWIRGKIRPEERNPINRLLILWLLFLSGYNLSIAVWVGLIALAGLDAETGVVMLLYLDQAFDQRRQFYFFRKAPFMIIADVIAGRLLAKGINCLRTPG